ncbi:MAG: hypothetical protein JOZ15_12145, partial [Acidobacteria bacterium]|nr:hypothetical protein [Acidobacteriota bacterium]
MPRFAGSPFRRSPLRSLLEWLSGALVELLGEAAMEALAHGSRVALVAASTAIGGALACSHPAAPPPGPAASAAATTAAPPPAAPELARSSRGGRQVLFVGLDGGDWQLLD